MWLKFGVCCGKSLIEISEVFSGKIDLLCPYCDGKLTAKKGEVKEHHFAHLQESCYPVVAKRAWPTLPLFDKFNGELSGKSLDLLKKLWQCCGKNNWGIPFSEALKPLIKKRLLKKNIEHHPSAYEFTALGKIPLGKLSLAAFNQIQEPLLLEKLRELERKATLAKTIESLNPAARLVDLQLYRAQYRSVLQQSLYFLSVEVDGKILHKIGVTKRPIQKRLAEIQRDLRSHFSSAQLEVLGLWPYRGNVEGYFKHRYRAFNYPIDTLTEYYQFNHDQALAVMHNLQKIQPKVLNLAEQDILASTNSHLIDFIGVEAV